MKRDYWISSYLGLAHGLNDACAAFLLSLLAFNVSLELGGWFFLLYNAIAFGGQIFAGFLTDHYLGANRATVAGLFLAGLAIFVGLGQPLGAVIIAGVGSAFFHVGGGAMVLTLTPNRTTGLGLFTAPGVIGLALGFGLAMLPSAYGIGLASTAFLVAVGLAKLLKELPPSVQIRHKGNLNRFDWHTIILSGLILVITLRSVVWTGLQAWTAGDYSLMLAMALAAGTGKFLGGITADTIGWQNSLGGGLVLAILLFTFGGENIVLLLIGIACLQSATPICLLLMTRQLPGYPATATGLALGLAIAMGGLGVMLLPAKEMPYLILVLIFTLGILWKIVRPINDNSGKGSYGVSHQRE